MANTDAETLLAVTELSCTQPHVNTINNTDTVTINDIAVTACQLPADADVLSPATAAPQPCPAPAADGNTLQFTTGTIQSFDTAMMLLQGWEVLVKKHKSGVHKGKFDKYWISPTKEKFSSIKKVKQHLQLGV